MSYEEERLYREDRVEELFEARFAQDEDRIDTRKRKRKREDISKLLKGESRARWIKLYGVEGDIK